MVGDCPPDFLQLTFNCCNVSVFFPLALVRDWLFHFHLVRNVGRGYKLASRGPHFPGYVTPTTHQPPGVARLREEKNYFMFSNPQPAG
jgi:hypothetical protein